MGTNRRPRPRKLARKLLTIRTRLGLSQAEMANKLNTKRSPVYPTHISEFERDLREPSLLVLLGYARLIDASTDVLIDDTLELPRE
jgi:transcriptional regulator with XRE-family HTH domain